MFERLKALFKQGKLSVLQLYRAMEKGWITKQQLESILDEHRLENNEVTQ